MYRKLATIFASDVVGFSKMMGTDEVNTLKILTDRRKVVDNNDNSFIKSLPYTKPKMIDFFNSCSLK